MTRWPGIFAALIFATAPLPGGANAMEAPGAPPGWQRVEVACFVYKNEKGLLGSVWRGITSPLRNLKRDDPATAAKKDKSFVQESSVPDIESQLNQFISKYTATAFKRLRSRSRGTTFPELIFESKEDCRKKRGMDSPRALRQSGADGIIYGVLDYDAAEGSITGTASLISDDLSGPVELAVAQTNRNITALLRSLSAAIARELNNGLDAENRWRLPGLAEAQGKPLRLMAEGSNHVRLALNGEDPMENRTIALIYYRKAHQIVNSDPAAWDAPDPGSTWGQVKSTLTLELARQLKPQEAFEVFEPFGDDHSDSSSILAAIGDSYYDESDYQSALELYERAARLDTASRDIHLKLASTRLALSSPSEITESARRGQVSDDLESYFGGSICDAAKLQEVVSLLVLRGLGESALDWLRQVAGNCELENRAEDPEYALYQIAKLGDQAHALGDADTAVWFYESAIAVAPAEHGDISHSNMSRVHYQLGVIYAEKEPPDFGVILQHYARSYAHDKRVDETSPYFYPEFRASLLLNYREAVLLSETPHNTGFSSGTEDVLRLITDELAICQARHAKCGLDGVTVFAEYYLDNLALVLRGDRPQIDGVFFDAINDRGISAPDRIYWDFELVERVLTARLQRVCPRGLFDQCDRTRAALNLTNEFANWRSKKFLGASK